MSFTLQLPTRSRHPSRTGMARATDKRRHRVTISPLQRTHSLIPLLKHRARTAATRPHRKLREPRPSRNLSMPTSSSTVVPLLVRWSRRLLQLYDLRRAIRPLVNPSLAPSRTLTERAACPRMNLSYSTDLCLPTTRGTNICPPTGTNDRPATQRWQRRLRVLFPERRRRSLGYTHKRSHNL